MIDVSLHHITDVSVGQAGETIWLNIKDNRDNSVAIFMPLEQARRMTGEAYIILSRNKPHRFFSLEEAQAAALEDNYIDETENPTWIENEPGVFKLHVSGTFSPIDTIWRL